MIIKTYEYNTSIPWTVGSKVWIRGIFDRDGQEVPGARVHHTPSTEDPALYIEMPERDFDLVVALAGVIT